MQFRHITTSFTICLPGHNHTPLCQWGKQFPTEGVEWVGTGLAIQHLCHQWRLQEYYSVMHIASGRLLTGSTTYYIVEAAIWLRLLKDVTDWTQPADILLANEALPDIVHAMREQAFRQYSQMRGKRFVDFDYAQDHTGLLNEA